MCCSDAYFFLGVEAKVAHSCTRGRVRWQTIEDYTDVYKLVPTFRLRRTHVQVAVCSYRTSRFFCTVQVEMLRDASTYGWSCHY